MTGSSFTNPNPAKSPIPVSDERDAAERFARRPWPASPINDLTVSFEFFPPATPAGEESLVRTAEVLAPFNPKFVSVTYGAGGTTQERTHTAIARVAQIPGLNVAGHLTCVGASQEAIGGVIDQYLANGVRHIVALRGDAPEGSDGTPRPDGYRDAAHLVEGIRKHTDHLSEPFEVSVGAYPEVHPKATSAQADMDNLKRKIDAGATRAITQFFFDADVYLRFLDRARAAGITVPILPGLMPVTNFAGVVRFSERAGTSVPKWMFDLFGGLDDNPEMQQLIAATIAAEQCRRLAEHGVTDFHFYTMNKPELTAATCRILGISPKHRAKSVGDSASADLAQRVS
jgi:methylenetetrahydrofolate reductase (NADPH)